MNPQVRASSLHFGAVQAARVLAGTVSCPQEHDLMNVFVGSEPHLHTMSRIDDWCDEATFVEWEQAAVDLPDWQDGYGRLVASGQGPSLTNATEAHHTRDFPAPVLGPPP